MRKALLLELSDNVLGSWWTIVAATCVGVAASVVVLHYSTPIYEARTKVAVTEQRIPRDYVRSTVIDDIEMRLGALRERVLSRPYMLKLISENFTLPETDEEQARYIKKIRSRVQVSRQRGRYFEISFRDTDPERTANVANALAGYYMEENARFRSTRAGEITKSVQEQAQMVLEELQVQEKQITDFKTKYIFQTADQMPSNLQLLRGRQADLVANERAAELAQERLQTLRAQEEQARLMSSLIPPDAEGATSPDPYVNELMAAQRELNRLLRRYHQDHPDVKSKKRHIDELLAKAPREDHEGASDEYADDPFAGLRQGTMTGKIRSQEREISRLQVNGERIRKDIDVFETRIEASPRVQQRLDDLRKGYDVLLRRYNELQAKVQDARAAEMMEEAQKGAQFEIIERAVPPALPIMPKPQMILAAGLAGGLLIFVGPLVVRRLIDPLIGSITGFGEVSRIPLMVSIPRIPTPDALRQKLRKRRINVRMSLASVAILSAVVLWHGMGG